jgi:hypothetical protein
VWQSHAHSATIKTDPSYALFLTKRQALSMGPIEDLHVSFTGNPRRSLEAPVTEVDFYVTLDADADATREVHERVRRLTYRTESLLVRGFVALNWGVPIEDGARGLYLAGWRSIEVRFRVFFLVLVLVLPRSFLTYTIANAPFFFLGRTT